MRWLRALDAAPGLVLGYAETATGLGHCVAEALDAHCLHSTRRVVDTVAPAGAFEELHSHATGHLLLPEDPALLTRPGPVVLVDDELSTGATALNTIAELQRLRPREQYVIATLVDLRSPADRSAMADRAAELATSITVVALASGAVRWPDDFADPRRRVRRRAPGRPLRPPGQHAAVTTVPTTWPDQVRDGGRHGFAPDDRRARGTGRGTSQAAAITPGRAARAGARHRGADVRAAADRRRARRPRRA